MEEEQKSLIDKANKIGSLLNGSWTIDQERLDGGYPGVFINGPEDKSLQFRIRWANTERLEISGSYRNGLNQHLPYDREKTKITVAKSKTYEQIAKDIERRLMPPYERVLARARELKVKADAYENEKMKALEAVKEAMGEGASIRQDEVIRYSPFCRAKCYGNEIKIELELPVDKAVEILRQI